MKLSEFDKIHVDRDTFIVANDHQVDLIEKVIKEAKDYNVVMKNNAVEEPGDNLNTTTIHHD